MKKAPKVVSIAEAYDYQLMREIEAQLLLAGELAELARELTAHAMQIERALSEARSKQMLRPPAAQ